MKVSYIDHMGTDLTVVNAARVSFGKTSEWADYRHVWQDYSFDGQGPRAIQQRDARLIEFLARGCTRGEWDRLIEEAATLWNDPDLDRLLRGVKQMPSHWTPFGHCQASLHLRIPIFVANQIKRHQVGFVVNEVSRRYVDDEPELYEPAQLRLRAENAKQGSSDRTTWEGSILTPVEGTDEEFAPSEVMSLAVESYNSMIEQGVCPEQARMVLPQSTYTEFWMTGSLYAWANLYVQRSDSHAQKETQEVARQIGEIVAPLFPVSWKELTK